MMEPIKSGQNLLDEFFADVTGIDGVDPRTANVVMRLFEEGKLTPTNISNELSLLRESDYGCETDED